MTDKRKKPTFVEGKPVDENKEDELTIKEKIKRKIDYKRYKMDKIVLKHYEAS